MRKLRRVFVALTLVSSVFFIAAAPAAADAPICYKRTMTITYQLQAKQPQIRPTETGKIRVTAPYCFNGVDSNSQSSSAPTVSADATANSGVYLVSKGVRANYPISTSTRFYADFEIHSFCPIPIPAYSVYHVWSWITVTKTGVLSKSVTNDGPNGDQNQNWCAIYWNFAVTSVTL
jgi:hypothetical protein